MKGHFSINNLDMSQTFDIQIVFVIFILTSLMFHFSFHGFLTIFCFSLVLLIEIRIFLAFGLSEFTIICYRREVNLFPMTLPPDRFKDGHSQEEAPESDDMDHGDVHLNKMESSRDATREMDIFAFHLGQVIDVLDSVNRWSEAEVVVFFCEANLITSFISQALLSM